MAHTESHSTTAPLAPADIRRIRVGLGLTQVEAGELLGGGLRAFQKYESGAISPAAPTANLLRLLEANPGALEALTGKKAKAIETQGLRPFEVSGQHICALTDRKFILLKRRLLSAEAQSNDIPCDGIHVASNLTAADGGEDARIVWTGGPDRTAFLPGRACLFQLKATDVSPSSAAADVLTTNKELEPEIEALLRGSGFYVMLCSRPYTHKLIASREMAVRRVIQDRGLAITDDQVSFKDADQIASWVNAHPAVATWVLEQTQPGLAGCFRTWSHWAGRQEHERVPYIDDPRLPELRDKLRSTLGEARGVLRLVGLSGIGKSRLALQALAPTDDEDAGQIALSDLVLYVVEPDAGTTTVKAAVQTLVDLGTRAIAVVDRCSIETHQVLSEMVMRSGSKISILTIDHELPSNRSPHTYVLEKAPEEVTEGILKAVVPGLRGEDQRRLSRFTQGYPQLAAMIGEAWLQDIPVATAPDATLIDRVVVGRGSLSLDKAVTLKAAMLVSAFSLLGFKENVEIELDAVLPFSGGLTRDDLKSALEDLRHRGVVQLRGRFATLEPRPIATALAERRWREWRSETWDDLLGGEKTPFAVRLAQRLTLLNDTEIAHEVATHLCRRSGPFDSMDALKIELNTEVLSNLAEIHAGAVAHLLDRVLSPLTHDELREISGRARRNLVHALEKIAFLPETFEDGANLMMAFALAENESWGNNATGQFCGLFQVMLGETAANGSSRIGMLDSALASNDERQLLLLVSALSQGAKVDHFSRMSGSESHGLRPAYEPWLPSTMDEAAQYIRACLERLLQLAKRGDPVGAKAKQNLASEFRALAGRGFLDFVERAVHEICEIHGRSWSEAVSNLGLVLVYDFKNVDSDERARVQALMDMLSPNDFDSRVQLLVTEMPWDYPCDQPFDFHAKARLQREAVEQLVDDLLTDPSEMKKAIANISVGEHRMAVAFGRALSQRADEALQWAWPILLAYRRAPEKTRNGDVVAGFYVGLADREPQHVARFKRAALRSPIFARLVPYIAWSIGLTEEDVALVREGLASGILPVAALQFWSAGGVLAKLSPNAVAPLFSELLAGFPEGWDVAVQLMGMYVHGDSSRLDQLRPQVRQLAETSDIRGPRSATMSNHHFQQVMTWMLAQGGGDADARAVALSLTRVLIAEAKTDGFIGNHRITPLIPILLSDYPETVWSLISKAIVEDPKSAWRFEFAFKDRTPANFDKTSALLNLSPDTLFAWCNVYPEVGPAFLAATIPLLDRINAGKERQLHPVIRRLLDEFGERQDVQNAISRNLNTFGWSGSVANYYRQYLAPVSELSKHANTDVRRWAKRLTESLNAQIEAHKRDDDERDAFWGN